MLLFTFKDNFNNFVDGLIPALVCIIVVFLILFIIMLLVMGLNSLKSKELKKENSSSINDSPQNTSNVNIEDEDMMVAVLIATIDYRNEVKKDVRLVNVKRIG
ncbi:MAG: OadG family protein [Erysipelotrichaceae bacterium]|nr:OadG family protein [Erysipelotrichaceae bacterium]